MRDKIIKVLGTHPPLKAIKIAPLVCERLENVHRVLRTLVSAKAIHVTGNGFYSLNREAPPPKPPRVIQPTKRGKPKPKKATPWLPGRPSGDFPHTPKPLPVPAPKKQPKTLDQQAYDMNNRRKKSKRLIDVITTNQQESPVDDKEKQKLMDQADDLAKTLSMPVVNIPELQDSDIKLDLVERLVKGMAPEMAIQFKQWHHWTQKVLALMEEESKGE